MFVILCCLFVVTEREFCRLPLSPPFCSVHSSPGAHISVDGCTFFLAVRPVYACFFNDLLLLHIRGVHGQAAGHMFYEPVHLDGAENKRLISNTAFIDTTGD